MSHIEFKSAKRVVLVVHLEIVGVGCLLGSDSESSELEQSKGFSREGNGTPLQYSCLGNPTDGGAW